MARLLALTLASASLAFAAAAPRPNILILFADDLGFNQLNLPNQPAGYTGVDGAIKTPHLAKMAAEGTTFQHWYSGFHVCTPSRASIMTGRLPVRVGLGDGVLTASAKGGLQTNETTVAEALQRVGYSVSRPLPLASLQLKSSPPRASALPSDGNVWQMVSNTPGSSKMSLPLIHPCPPCSFLPTPSSV